MTQLTDSQLKTQLDAYIFQNVSRLITGANVNEFLTNLNDSKVNKNSPLLGFKEFDISRDYSADTGDAVIKDGIIYQATTNHTGVWNPAHFTSLLPTIQQVCDASTFPLITSDDIGGFIIRNGQSLDTNTVFEIQNIAGLPTFTVGGNGIIANGNWQADTVAAGFGGTGYGAYTAGDMLYASNTSSFAKLGIGSNLQVMQIVGGVPTWQTLSTSSIYSASGTITDNARVVTLKSGGGTSQYLEFDNYGGGNLLKLIGNNSIDFGSTTNGITSNMYLSTVSGSFGVFNIYGSDNSLAHQFRGNYGTTGSYYRQAVAANTSELIHQVTNAGVAELRIKGTDTGRLLIRKPDDHGGFQVEGLASGNYLVTGFNNSDGVNMRLYGTLAGGWYAFGGDTTYGDYRMEIYGSTMIKGSGSANIAIFKNSSNNTSLTLKEDLSAIFDGDVVLSQSTNSTATGANARIASHPTSTIVLTNASLTSVGSIIAGVSGGHLITLMNETGASISIVDAYGSAAAGEVIYTNTASNLTLRDKCGATFQYNATGACWTKI